MLISSTLCTAFQLQEIFALFISWKRNGLAVSNLTPPPEEIKS